MAAVPDGAPGPDDSKAPLLIGLSTFLHVVSLSLFGARMWTRTIPRWRLGLDDYFLMAAVVSVKGRRGLPWT